MKKAMWIIVMLALAGTAAALLFLPETVPVHFDAAWTPDRWGSRWELLLLPGFMLLLALIWRRVLNAYEKKADGAGDEKAGASAGTNRKAAGIAGVSLNAMLALVQAWLLMLVFRAASGGESSGDIPDRLPLLLVGVLTVVLGSIMPKTRRSGLIGFRMAWSMYNDETWRRTHRFGGYVMGATGILLVLTAVLISPPLTAAAVFLALIAAMILVTLVYAHKVYREEKERSEGNEG